MRNLSKEGYIMDITYAIQKALDGDAILFLGSGASTSVLNKNGDTMPIGKKLANRIYSGCDDLQQSMDLYLEDMSIENIDAENAFIQLLKNEFESTGVSEPHEELCRIPWKRIYTTNYDDIVERTYSKNSINLKSLTLNDSAADALSEDKLVYLHINGYIKRLTKQTLKSEFKLSDTSYNTDDFSNSDWGCLFREDIKAYSCIIFIGFSLKYDLDIRRILSHYSKNKCMFIVEKGADPTNIRYLSKYGHVEAVGLDGFVSKVKNISSNYTPKKCSDLSTEFLTNFENKSSYEPSITKPTDKQVIQYYTLGKRCNDIYYELEKNSSIIRRSQVNAIVEDIKSGVHSIFIHSDLGNGKTEVVEQLSRELSNDYDIFLLNNNNDKISKEIVLICNNDKKTIIIIENFFNYIDVYKKLKLFDKNKNIQYIFTARTSIYRARVDELDIELGLSKSYNFNSLNESELHALSGIFEKYGFYTPYCKDEKDMKTKCNSKLQSVMLSIFDNSQISENLTKAFEAFKTDPESYKLILFIMLSRIMSLSIGFQDILDLLKIRTYNSRFENNQHTCEFLDWNNGVASIKSVALCVWTIKTLSLGKEAFDLLIEAAKVADLGYTINKNYQSFLGNIISYKHLKFVLDCINVDKKQKFILINNFYQELKTLNYNKNKYYFWLQYAISSLELEEYDAAELHFKAAYASLPKDMQPFEIDNQYARLKLEYLLAPISNYSTDTLNKFFEIDKLLTPTSIKSDDEYYSYKMANAYYRKFLDKFYHSMNDDEKTAVKEIMKNKHNMCDRYIKKNKNINFNKYLQDYKNEFLKLAFYD